MRRLGGHLFGAGSPLRVLWLAPWRRAPLLLVATPGVFLAVALGVAVLAVAAASGPLFLSSTGSASLARSMAAECPQMPLPSVAYPRDILSRRFNPLQDERGLHATDAQVQAAMADTGLPQAMRVLVAGPSVDLGAGRGSADVTLFSRAGALDHVTVLRRTAGQGLWFSDLAAARLGLRLGDLVRVGTQSARVVGIYRDLNGPGFGRGVPRYWCSWSQLILTRIDFRPPPLVLTDDPTLLRFAHAFAQLPNAPVVHGVSATWYSTLDTRGLTVSRARDRLDRSRRLPAMLVRRAPALAGAVSYRGDLDEHIARATDERAGVRGPVLPVGLAGTVVAILLVAGTGGYWAERRSREVTLLTARGVGPVGIGTKAMVEVLPAAVVGGVVGWAGARLLVTTLGPSRLLEPGADVEAAVSVAIALAAGVLTLAVLAGTRSRSSSGRARAASPGWWRRVPWELLPLGLALLTYRAIRDGSGVHLSRNGVLTVSPLLVLFPLLALLGGLMVATRATTVALPLLRRASTRFPSAGYLATSRMTGAARITVGLIILVSVPIGLLVYAGVVTTSASATVRAKANIYVGAEAVLVMNVPPGSTPRLDSQGTVVSVFQNAHTAAGQTQVLGLNPATFAEFAYDNPRLVGDSTAALVRRVTATSSSDGAVPAILVGCSDCGPVDRVTLRTSTLPVRVVDRRPMFPGLRLLRSPMLVVDRRTLGAVDNFADRQEELWTTNRQLPAASTALDRQHVSLFYRKTPDGFLDVVDLVPLTWTFGYLEALAGLTGLIAFAALLLYLGARQRTACLSYLLARRMGLSRRTHLWALTNEIGGLLTYGWALGLGSGALASVLVDPLLDLNPDFPPPSLFRLPALLLAGTVVGTIAVTVVGVLTTQHVAERQPAAEILKLGT